MPVIKMNNTLSAFVNEDRDKSVSSFKPDIQRHVYTPVEKPANLKKEFTNSEFHKWHYLHEKDVLKRVGLKSFEELFKRSKAATIRQKVNDVDTETQARAIKQAIQSNDGIDESVLDDSRFSKEVWKDIDLIDYEAETTSTVHQIENLIMRYEEQKKADFEGFCEIRSCTLSEEEFRFCRLFWMMSNKDVLRFFGDTHHIDYLRCFDSNMIDILRDCTMKLMSCGTVEEYHQKLKSGVFGDTNDTTKLLMNDAEQKLWSYVEKASEWLSRKEQELREVEGAKVRAKEIKARDDAFKARLKSKLEELEVNADLRQKNEVRKMQDWIDQELCH